MGLADSLVDCSGIRLPGKRLTISIQRSGSFLPLLAKSRLSANGPNSVDTAATPALRFAHAKRSPLRQKVSPPLEVRRPGVGRDDLVGLRVGEGCLDDLR